MTTKIIGDSIHIANLKRKLRSAYIEYNDEVSKYDCGAMLAEHINPRLYTLRMNVNSYLDALAKIDPTTPEDRL